MIRKFSKKNPVGDLVIRVPPKLVGGAFFYGKIRAGKTTAMMSISQRYLPLGYKIFDIYGGERNENLYWCIKSNQVNYWDKVKKRFNIKDEQEGPKEYKVNILYPFLFKKLPKKLPNFPPRVKSKIFTIPINSITFEDIRLAMNTFSDKNQGIWIDILEEINKDSDCNDLLDICKNLKIEKQIIYKNLLKPLSKDKLLQSENCPYNLDIISEMKERDTITVLCLEHVPTLYKLFIIGWILRNIKEYLDQGKIPKRNIFLIREASDFFRARNEAVIEDRIKYFKIELTKYIRYGRRGMHMFVDTQSPSETRGIVEGSQDLTFIGRIPATSREDRASLIDTLYSVGKITPKQVTQLADLRSGEFLLISNQDDARRRYVLLPRTLYWKEKYKNFEKVWEKYIDKWVLTKADKDYMDDISKGKIKKVMEKERFDKILDEIKDIKPLVKKTEPIKIKAQKIIKVKVPKKKIENYCDDDFDVDLDLEDEDE